MATRLEARVHEAVAGRLRNPPRDDGGRRASEAVLGEIAGGVTMAQAARVLTGLLWLTWGSWLTLQPATWSSPLVSMFVAAAGVVVMGLAVVIRGAEAQRRLDLLLISGTLAVVIVLPAMGLTGTGYTTDELAYGQSAAAALLHGVNPYGADLTASLQTFGVGTQATMTLNGTLEPHLNYPALSFLVYVPAVLAFGARSYAGVLVDIAAWGFAGWVMWRVLDERLRPWVPVLVALPALLGSVITGATDSLFIPFEIVAVCCWDRFADPRESGAWRWVGPVALGLACGMKQQPWLLAPFLLIGVSLEAHRRGLRWWRVGSRYAGLAFLAFLVPNLPFIFWDPRAWIGGLLTPFTGGLVPMGLGPAALMRPLTIGGGNLTLFAFAGAAALTATLALFVTRYESLRRLLPLLPVGALFLSTRSFASYMTFCVPALLVNAASLRQLAPSAARPAARRTLTMAGLGLGGLAAALVMAALLVPPPLRISVTRSSATATQLTIVAQVENAGARTVTPHFFLAKGPYYNQVLRQLSGPSVLAPGEGASYTFSAVESVSTPHPGEAFQLQAGMDSPAAIATSAVAVVAPAASSATGP